MPSVKMEPGNKWDEMKAEIEQLRYENKILKLERELSVMQHELGQSTSMQASSTPVAGSDNTRRVFIDCTERSVRDKTQLRCTDILTYCGN